MDDYKSKRLASLFAALEVPHAKVQDYATQLVEVVGKLTQEINRRDSSLAIKLRAKQAMGIAKVVAANLLLEVTFIENDEALDALS